MKLEELTVSQFRCWTYRQFSFSGQLNYLRGPNGSGKTSILEAIHYLSAGRSFRSNRDSTCLMWGANSFSLSGEFLPDTPDSDPFTLSLSYARKHQADRKRKKIAKRNGSFIEKLSELRRHVITILFTPDDINVLKGGPDRRRAFLDELLSVLEDSYLDELKEYEENRSQRNSLLKQPSPDELLLDQYDEELITTGREIIRMRQNIIPDLQESLRTYVGRILDLDPEEVELVYSPDSEVETYSDRLRSSRQRDLERGYTTRGPHRDDWTVQIEGREVDRFASQGELRTLLLALKLSCNSVIIDQVFKEPILLLDDLESELDETRKKRVLSLLKDCPSQVVITGTGGLDPVELRESSDRILSLEAG